MGLCMVENKEREGHGRYDDLNFVDIVKSGVGERMAGKFERVYDLNLARGARFGVPGEECLLGSGPFDVDGIQSWAHICQNVVAEVILVLVRPGSGRGSQLRNLLV